MLLGSHALTTLKDRRVLLVEDETLIAMMVEDMLADLGCTVVGPASDLDEAFALLEEHNGLDAALLDVNLAGSSVFPLADELRGRGVPLIFTTGYGDAGLRDADRGAAVLRKPYRAEELAAAISAAVTP